MSSTRRSTKTGATRGARSEEQIDLMRQLWTNELITYEGKWHKITDAGILPLPVQRPIPVWLGGAADRTIRRIVSIGDGWILTGRPDDRAKGLIDKLHAYAEEAGRDIATIGLEGWVSGQHRRSGRVGKRSRRLESARRNACIAQHHARRPSRPGSAH